MEQEFGLLAVHLGKMRLRKMDFSIAGMVLLQAIIITRWKSPVTLSLMDLMGFS